MDQQDLHVRNLTYRHIVETGWAPGAADVAKAAGIPESDVEAAWRRLHDAHALVLDDHGAIRMLNPFSAVPTTFRVTVGDRTWFANCGWDAFGIGAALHEDSVIDTECADCHEPVRIDVRDGRPEPGGLIWHVPAPASDWWVDIGST